jgi:hypothetical protein
MSRSSPEGTRCDRGRYELEVEDRFREPDLDEHLWIPACLPRWSSRAAAAARYRVGGGSLELPIEADQQPWCPEFDGQLRTSSLQTGIHAGPLGSAIGHRPARGPGARPPACSGRASGAPEASDARG